MRKISNFCSECKKEVVDLRDLLFVEETTTKGFCSEACIMSFYNPYMEFFSDMEMRFKESLLLDEFDDFSDYYLNQEMLSTVTDEPDDLLSVKNELGASYYLQIKYFSSLDLYYMIICSHYDSKPSFIYNKLITKSEKLVELYRKYFEAQERAATASEGDLLESISLPDDIMQNLELKKSQYLAFLLEKRRESDIPFESFPIYDDYISLTLSDPDSIFAYEDDSGDEISNYIKTYKKAGKDFYFVVCCLKVSFKEGDSDKIALLPVISFPSIDKDLYSHYAIGDSHKKHLKN